MLKFLKHLFIQCIFSAIFVVCCHNSIHANHQSQSYILPIDSLFQPRNIFINNDSIIKLKPFFNWPEKQDNKGDKINPFINRTPQESLVEALEYYEIEHADIVYAQAVLETGNFKSRGAVVYNNLFGLMKNGRLRRFNHWTESIVCYKEKIQNRYRSGCYYSFLNRIRYASDRHYTSRLKQIIKQQQSKN